MPSATKTSNPMVLPKASEGNSLSAGDSAPRVFKTESFDYNFAKFLGLAPYSGAEIGECYVTAHAIEDGNEDSWMSAWQPTRRRVEEIAKVSLERGHRVSAREAFLRATSYYQAAFFFLGCDDSPTRRPTVLMQMGGDGTAIQLYFSGGGAAALRRGRADVDTDRIALVGYSMGGYFGPRAVAFEKRISACIANSLLPDVYTPVVRTMGMQGLIESGAPVRADELTAKQRYSLDEGMPRFGFHGVEEIADWGAQLKTMNLFGLEDKITCPVLNVSASGEGENLVNNARAFFATLSNPKNKFVLTTEEQGADMHCQKGNASLMHQIEFDWLDEVFGN